MKSKAPLTQTNQEKFQGRNKSKLWQEQQQEDGQKSTLLRLLETKSRDQRQNKTEDEQKSRQEKVQHPERNTENGDMYNELQPMQESKGTISAVFNEITMKTQKAMQKYQEVKI